MKKTIFILILSFFCFITSNLAFSASTTESKEADEKIVLLIDLSASMLRYESKIKEMAVNIKKLHDNTDIYGFNTKLYPLNDISELKKIKPTANTDLASALSKLKDSRYLVLITDGLPDDRQKSEAIMKSMKSLGSKFCIGFIGETRYTPGFLKDNADFFINDESLEIGIKNCMHKIEEKRKETREFSRDVDLNALIKY